MKFSEYKKSNFVKALYIGDSGTGKTGSLVSLVKDGYKLRILDMDDGLPVLYNFVMKECPDKVDQIDYETIRDHYVSGRSKAEGQKLKVSNEPTAYNKALMLLDKWSDGSIPEEWGEDIVFVLDSLSSFSQAAFNWAVSVGAGNKDQRSIYDSSQRQLHKIIQRITGPNFATNVLIMAHIEYYQNDQEITRGQPVSIGAKLGPKIPREFNTYIGTILQGKGDETKRFVTTVPTTYVTLKTPAPFSVKSKYDLGTGLSRLFKDLKSWQKEEK